MSEHFTNPVTSALRDHAMTFPETSEGASCVNRAFQGGGVASVQGVRAVGDGRDRAGRPWSVVGVQHSTMRR